VRDKAESLSGLFIDEEKFARNPEPFGRLRTN
jgi:hypothetical protein